MQFISNCYTAETAPSFWKNLREGGARDHTTYCTDPFCSGCGQSGYMVPSKGPSNSSECKTINVQIVRLNKNGSMEGESIEGDNVWIHNFYSKKIKEIRDPISFLGKVFKMIILRREKERRYNMAWKCIEIYSTWDKYYEDIIIYHPIGSYPNNEGSSVSVKIDAYKELVEISNSKEKDQETQKELEETKVELEKTKARLKKIETKYLCFIKDVQNHCDPQTFWP